MKLVNSVVCGNVFCLHRHIYLIFDGAVLSDVSVAGMYG